MKNIFSILAIAVLLSGCNGMSSLFENSSVLTVQIDAEPADTATYYMDGVRFTERVRHIELSEEERNYGTYTIDLPEVRWPSGAVVPQARQTLSLEKMSHHITIRHPSLNSVEGRFDRNSQHVLTLRYESNPAGAQFILAGSEELTSATKSIPLT
ncbi:MAG: hypothetical protein PF495_21450 [Spirochaetales bacterium]|jgi:hypothetical protein|nr:hypothetical protein [Spirochaetales bacterium]